MMLYSTIAEPARETTWRPAADVYQASDGWLLKFELAGLQFEDISILVNGPTLTVSGIRRDRMAEQGFCQYSMEISYSRFERTIQLPCNIDGAAIGVDYRNGILLVHVSI